MCKIKSFASFSVGKIRKVFNRLVPIYCGIVVQGDFVLLIDNPINDNLPLMNVKSVFT
ncbi:MAG: hypothetical protein FWC97_04780 [Treponema sp.]|nr:hypothetical protein [Treponema sp.]